MLGAVLWESRRRCCSGPPCLHFPNFPLCTSIFSPACPICPDPPPLRLSSSLRSFCVSDLPESEPWNPGGRPPPASSPRIPMLGHCGWDGVSGGHRQGSEPGSLSIVWRCFSGGEAVVLLHQSEASGDAFGARQETREAAGPQRPTATNDLIQSVIYNIISPAFHSRNMRS